jgi:hypothetical protein
VKSLVDIPLIDDITGLADGEEELTETSKRILNSIDQELSEVDSLLEKPLVTNEASRNTRRRINYPGATSGDWHLEVL